MPRTPESPAPRSSAVCAGEYPANGSENSHATGRTTTPITDEKIISAPSVSCANHRPRKNLSIWLQRLQSNGPTRAMRNQVMGRVPCGG